jgi:hypothetical protein
MRRRPGGCRRRTRYGAGPRPLWAVGPVNGPSWSATALNIPHRVAVFADAYGMTAQHRAELGPFAVDLARRYHENSRASAELDPVFRRLWEDGASLRPRRNGRRRRAHSLGSYPKHKETRKNCARVGSSSCGGTASLLEPFRSGQNGTKGTYPDRGERRIERAKRRSIAGEWLIAAE